MPLYEFRCAAGHLEERLSTLEEAPRPCSCGRMAVRNAVNRFSPIAAAPRRLNLAKGLEADAEMKHNYQRAGLEPPDIVGAAARHVARLRRAR